MKRMHMFATAVALLHLLGVILTASYISGSSESQAPLVWVYWFFIDVPWSLLFWNIASGSLAVFHGVVGTLWWYVLAMLVWRLIAFVRTKAVPSRTSKRSR